jgi:hypothetical protein
MSDIDRTLQALGFVAGDDGVLSIRETSVTLTPVDGHFYRLEIALPHGNVLTIHVAKNALKVGREGKVTPPEPEIDPAALISGTSKRRPW